VTERRGARRQALRGLVGALMVVGAAAAVTAANMSLLLYADGRGAHPLRAQEYAQKGPDRLTAEPEPRATERPRPRRQRATADRAPKPSSSPAEQNAGERARGSVVEVTQQELDNEQQKLAEELDRAQKEKERAFQREVREREKALEREQRELDTELARAGTGQERPGMAEPAGEHDDD